MSDIKELARKAWQEIAKSDSVWCPESASFITGFISRQQEISQLQNESKRYYDGMIDLISKCDKLQAQNLELRELVEEASAMIKYDGNKPSYELPNSWIEKAKQIIAVNQQ